MDESGHAPAASARAAALDGAGVLAETQGHYERAQALHAQALAFSRELDDRAGDRPGPGQPGRGRLRPPGR